MQDLKQLYPELHLPSKYKENKKYTYKEQVQIIKCFLSCGATCEVIVLCIMTFLSSVRRQTL